MNAQTYARARAAGFSARTALAIARNDAEPLPDPGQSADLGTCPEGFDLALTVDYDEGMSIEDLGYGTFLDGVEDWRTGYSSRPEPDAIPNPYRDSRNVSNGRAWYVPGAAGTLRERAAYYNGSTFGASRSVALDLARESVADELRTVTDDYGPSVYVLTVKASRAGVTLGRASLGGYEAAWDPITRSGATIDADTVADLIAEAVAEATETLAELVA